MLAQELKPGAEVTHPNWLGRARKGIVVQVVNRWHADIQFDDYERTVRADIGMLEAVPKPKDAEPTTP